MIHPDIVQRVALYQPTIPVGDLWVLFARAQLVHDLCWLSRQLWEVRVASWLTSEAAGEHCSTCGALLGGGRSDRSYCGSACRMRASRIRSKGGLTPMEGAVSDAEARMREWSADLEGWGRWYRRQGGAQILPPDLLQVQHLPRLPGRCGRGCSRGVGCSHTDGHACLYAATGGVSR